MRAFFSPLLGVSLLLTASACGKGDPVQELCELALTHHAERQRLSVTR